MIKLGTLKKRDPITDTMTLPTSTSQKARYKRIQRELEKRQLESIHGLTRGVIDKMLDDLESQFGTAG